MALEASRWRKISKKFTVDDSTGSDLLLLVVAVFVRALFSSKVDDTVESVKAVPTNAQIAAKQKVDDLATQIKSVPDNIVAAAKVRKAIIKKHTHI